MPKFDSSVGQNLANEQSAVAMTRISLAADQCDPVAMSTVNEALDGGPKRLLLGHRSVQRMSFGVVVLLVRWATPELCSEEQVADAALSYRGLELVAVEVRREPRVRKGSHIDEELDSLAQNELRKVIELMIRMAYGPHSKTRRHRHSHGRDCC
jgi:hypothetical protein